MEAIDAKGTIAVLGSVLVAIATACSPSSGGGTSGTNGSSTSGGTGAPRYDVSCSGDVKASFHAELRLSPRCFGGDSGTQGCDDPCAKQDVAFSYSPPSMRCPSTDIWVWDGRECVAHPTQTNDGAMHCTGVSCPDIFKTLDACKAAYAKCAPSDGG